MTLVGVYAYARIWMPHQKMRDAHWLETASPEEQRKTAEQILRLPVGNHQDAYLLNGLKKFGDADFIECSHDHCVEALKNITGLDAGYRYADWRQALGQR